MYGGLSAKERLAQLQQKSTKDSGGPKPGSSLKAAANGKTPAPKTETAKPGAKDAVQAKEEAKKPEPAKPKDEPKKPEPVKPTDEPKKPEPVKPKDEPKKPEPVKPKDEPQKPEPVKPKDEPKKPEPVKPKDEPKKPEPVKPKDEPKKPEPVKPKDEPEKPEPVKPKDEPKKLEPVKPKDEPKQIEPSKSAAEIKKPELATSETEPKKPEAATKPVPDSQKPEANKSIETSKKLEPEFQKVEPKKPEPEKLVEKQPNAQVAKQTEIKDQNKPTELQSVPAQQTPPTATPSAPPTAVPNRPEEPVKPKEDAKRKDEEKTTTNISSAVEAKPVDRAVVEPGKAVQASATKEEAKKAETPAKTAEVPRKPEEKPVQPAAAQGPIKVESVATVSNAAPIKVEQVQTGASNAAPIKVEQVQTGVSNAAPIKVEQVQAGASNAAPIKVEQVQAGVSNASPIKVEQVQAGGTSSTPQVTGTEPKAKDAEFRAAEDDFYANIFYFFGMGSLIGSALASGVYVPEKTQRNALEAEEVDQARAKHDARRGGNEIIVTARQQAQGLSADFRQLQSLLESLPTFTEAPGAKPYDRRAVDEPIHGHVYFSHEQRPQRSGQAQLEPVISAQTTVKPAHPVAQDSGIASYINQEAYQKNSVTVPRDASNQYPFGSRDGGFTASQHPPTQSQSIASRDPDRRGASRMNGAPGSGGGGILDSIDQFDRALAADAAATASRAFGLASASVPPPSQSNRYETSTTNTTIRHYENAPDYGGPRDSAVHHGAGRPTSSPRPYADQGISGGGGGGSVDATGIKPWQLSHLRSLEAKGYNIVDESEKSFAHGAPSSSSFPYYGGSDRNRGSGVRSPYQQEIIEYTPVVAVTAKPTGSINHPYAASLEMPYCDL